MPKKLYDVAVKTGEYTNQQGETKGRWQNVGAVLEFDDGGKAIVLERWFNPAGIANPDGRTSVMLSMFPPKDREQPQQQAPSQQQRAPQPQQTLDDFDDQSIPF
jgi:single-stranded DNA-binding protein